uniref:Uncharacterized protein n=1 Tax=Tanacetum cinerariifolium TaxID=118510 RepID=A0A6L2MVK1_TANCI|nr:hypothetical protein [Tanacetum cinerariifolium]
MADAKEMWEAIKSRFGGNDESKKIAEIDVGYNGNKARDNGRRLEYHDDSIALVTIDGEDIDWSRHVEEDTQNYATMAYSSNNSGSNNEVSDLEHTSINDRYDDGMHAVSPPMTGNYMPSGPDVEIDYSKVIYGPKQTSVDESDSKPSESISCESDSSVETPTSMPEPVESAPKVICEPKVWTDAPIIEEENVKETDTPNHSPNIEKQDRNGYTRKGLGYAFTRKSALFWVLALEQSKTAQDLMIKKLQKKVKRIERKIKARTSGMTLFKIGNFKRKCLDKENVSKQGRYLKTRPMFEESDFDNIDDMVDEDND